MKDVIIIGFGGHSKVVADIVRTCGDNVVGFLDRVINSEKIIGLIEDYKKYRDEAEFIVAIGNAGIRERISRSMDCRWYTAIHPSAVISPDVIIGEGSVVAPNAVINSGAVVGRHCIINTNSVVEHDNIIGDFVQISVGAQLGGTVKIGSSTWVGIGATVKNNVSVCGNCMIGAGAVIVKDITEPGTYIGIPAKKKM